MHDKLFYSMI